MFKKRLHRLEAILAAVFTAFFTLISLPVYAADELIQSSEASGTSNQEAGSVQVQYIISGDGNVTFTDTQTKDSVCYTKDGFSAQYPAGTEIQFSFEGNLQNCSLNGKNVSTPSVWTAQDNAVWHFSFEDYVLPVSGTLLDDYGGESARTQSTYEQRMQTAQALDVADAMNGAGYLPYDYWESHPEQAGLAYRNDYASIEESGVFQVSSTDFAQPQADIVHGMVANVIQCLNVTMPWGGVMSNGYFIFSNANFGFCANGLLASPSIGDRPSSQARITNKNILKAMYYGFDGPDNRLKKYGDGPVQVLLTSELVSYANCGQCISKDCAGGWHWANGVQSVYNEIMALPDPPSNFTGYMLNYSGQAAEAGPGGTRVKQQLVYWEWEPVVEKPQYGQLRLRKRLNSSIDTTIVSGSEQYPYEGQGYISGAVYGLYQSRSDALNNRNCIGQFAFPKGSTYSNTISNLSAGTYYVAEITPPYGFSADTTVTTVNVTANSSGTALATSTVYDTPLTSNLNILIEKTDSNGKGLAGAQFTVKYYKAYYTQSQLSSKTPAKTWVLQSDSNGRIYLENSYKIAGDSFYTINGTPVLPLGTVTIQETKAPDGYEPDNTLYVQLVRQSVSGTAERWKTPSVRNTSITLPPISLKKVDGITNAALPGTVFKHTLPDGSSETLTTDSNGELTFSAIPGTHYFEETKAPDGYLLMNQRITVVVSSSHTITSVTNGEQTGTGSFVVDDQKIPGWSIHIKKTDEDNAPLAGAVFSITSSRSVSSDGSEEGPEAETSPESSLQTDLESSSDSSSRQPGQESSVSETASVQADNQTQSIEEMESKSSIESPDHDSTSEAVSTNTGSDSLSQADEDAKASQTVTTDASGEIRLENLVSGVTYTIQEVQAPEGYELPDPNDPVTVTASCDPNTGQYTVTIDGKQSSDFVTNSDGSITITITRINKITGEPLPDTGSFWTIALLVIGCALAAAGVYMNRKQNQ